MKVSEQLKQDREIELLKQNIMDPTGWKEVPDDILTSSPVSSPGPYAELHIIITPTGVDKIQLLAADDAGEVVGLELYQKTIQEIQRFTHRINEVLDESTRIEAL